MEARTPRRECADSGSGCFCSTPIAVWAGGARPGGGGAVICPPRSTAHPFGVRSRMGVHANVCLLADYPFGVRSQHTSMHTDRQTDGRTGRHTRIHTYVHTYTHTRIHLHVHTHAHTESGVRLGTAQMDASHPIFPSEFGWSMHPCMHMHGYRPSSATWRGSWLDLTRATKSKGE